MVKESSTQEKLIVCGTAFSCACALFAAAIFFLIPLLGTVMQTVNVADIIQQGVVLFLLFGLPVLGAFWGLHLGMQFIEPASNQAG